MSHRKPKEHLRQAAKQSRCAEPLPNGRGSFFRAPTENKRWSYVSFAAASDNAASLKMSIAEVP
eukprot:6333062-Pyramimonas_sp.AAC.1